MFRKRILIILIFLLYTLKAQTKGPMLKILGVKTKISNSNIISFELKVENSALSGIIDIKEPLTDRLLIATVLERKSTDTTKITYEPTILNFPQQTLTKIMNGAYKQFALPTLKDCASGLPQFQSFTPPLSIRKISFNNCTMERNILLRTNTIYRLGFAIACLALHYYSFDDRDILTSFLATGTFTGYIVVVTGVFAGVLMRAPIHKRIDIFFSVLGCSLFIASGVFIIEVWEYSFRTRTRDLALIKASLSIVNGVLFGFDAVFTFREK